VVTGLFWVIQADRARWRRQAAAGLAAILDAHPGFAAIAWTAGPAGCMLAGRVNGLAPAGQVRDEFDAWRAALALEEYREHQPGGGATWLHAAARRDLVRVRLTAAAPAGVQEEDQ
jgi:hypothetical protein